MKTYLEVGKYGFLFIKDSGEYLTSSNPTYSQTSFSGETDSIESFEDGIIILNLKDETITSNLLEKNRFKYFEIKRGWNMFGNSFDSDLELSTYFPNALIWILRDGEYFGFSSDEVLKKKIEIVSNYTDTIFSGEACWILSDKDKNISFDKYEISKFQHIESEQFQFKAISSTAIPTSYFKESIIFYFDNIEQNWQVSKNGKRDKDYPFLENIEPIKGYFTIRKRDE